MSDLYGYTKTDLDAAKDELERVLNIRMVAAESLFYGGDYFRSEKGYTEKYILRSNIDPYDDVPEVEEFADFKILLYVDMIASATRQQEIERVLTQSSGHFQLLERKSYGEQI
jgi:hypothetical protein